jgi:Cytochrome C oxidase, cbb3-type, subunit III
LRKAPLGYFFSVMTNGFGAMPDYAQQISAQDRWAVVSYIRALQLSQAGTAADASPGQPVPSPVPVFRGDPPSGATLPEMEPQGADSAASDAGSSNPGEQQK